MQSNQDLNSNLIKSLTSVHLPPPPSSHSQLSKPNHQHNHSHGRVSSHTPHQPSSTVSASQYSNNSMELDTLITSKEMVHQKQQARTKRKSSTSDDLQAPLKTPPHTVSRSDVRPLKKAKVQETPTMNPSRIKKLAKNPLSPQYSSPSSSGLSELEATTKVSKPSPPSFVTTKSNNKKKSQPAQKVHVIEEVPSPSKMPKIIHDSDSKPPYSYATLIGMAILRGEDRKLTLSQIYSWISSTFKYYRKNDVGWQNSIRHNLSLNKAFIKTEKSSDGKGHYWEVVRGYEMQFIKGKSGKKLFGSVQLDSNTSVSGSEDSTIPSSTPSSRNSSKQDTDSKPSQQPPSQQLQQPNQSKQLSEKTTAFKSYHSYDISSSEDEEYYSDTNEGSKTPQAQIRSTDFEITDRPSLKKSHTVIGLQTFSLGNNQNSLSGENGDSDNVESFRESSLPTKKQQMKSVSSTTDGSLKSIPSLQAPETTWAASASGQHVIFGQYKPDIIIDSPPKAARFSTFPLTSSFSCNTNFELSPLKRQETGPLLEPLTPSSRVAPSLTNSNEIITSNSIQSSTFLSAITKTPLRTTSANNQNMNSGIMNSSQASHFYNFLRTPNSRIKTPNSNSIMKKFWNSPSFIDDFYTSPSIPRNSDDDYDYKARLFGSPDQNRLRRVLEPPSSLSSALNGTISPMMNKRQQFMEHSGSYGVSDLFGVDICTVVQRAVENETHHKVNNHHNLSVEHHDNSTDDELEGNTTV